MVHIKKNYTVLYIYTYCCFFLCSVVLSYPALCDFMDCSLPGSSVCGILQARTLEWVLFLSPGDHHDSQIKPGSPAL